MFSISVAGKTQLLDHKDVPIADVGCRFYELFFIVIGKHSTCWNK